MQPNDRWCGDRAGILGLILALGLSACAPPEPSPPPQASPPEAAASPAAPRKEALPEPPVAPEPPPEPATATLEPPVPEAGPAQARTPPDARLATLAPRAKPEPPVAPASEAEDRPASAGAEPGPSAGAAGRATAYWAGSGVDPDAESPWRRLARDGIHDPGSGALQYLQEPRDALSSLPGDRSGNFVNWVTALDSGAIAPRARVAEAGEMARHEGEVVFADTRAMPKVTFSHRIHTAWLGCDSCHPEPFPRQAGASNIAMTEILKGRYCGLCHGRVAFPLSECFRCHNVGPRRGVGAVSGD